jgi:hypothetical protein
MATKTAKNPRGAGRRLLYNPKVHDPAAVALAELGATTAQLAQGLGTGVRTLENWMKKFPDFGEQVRAAKDAYDSTVVEKSLLRACSGYTFVEKYYELRFPECKDGEPAGEPKMTLVKRVKKHYPPSPRSIEYWLNNRQSDRWGARVNLDVRDLSYEKLLHDFIKGEDGGIDEPEGDAETEVGQ